MIANNLMPEGWIDKATILGQNDINKYLQNNQTLQGIVEECDSNYNLHIKLGNNIQGVIPREEVEGINIGLDGLPKVNLCTGKVNKYVQFKIKEVKDDNTVILSRKDVQNEAIQWAKNDLKAGDIVTRNSKKNGKLWSFYRNRRRISRISPYRRFINCTYKISI